MDLQLKNVQHVMGQLQYSVTYKQCKSPWVTFTCTACQLHVLAGVTQVCHQWKVTSMKTCCIGIIPVLCQHPLEEPFTCFDGEYAPAWQVNPLLLKTRAKPRVIFFTSCHPWISRDIHPLGGFQQRRLTSLWLSGGGRGREGSVMNRVFPCKLS